MSFHEFPDKILPAAVENILSILPPDAREPTALRLLQLYHSPREVRPPTLLWTQMDHHGRLQTGGSTDVVFGWTEIHRDPQQHETLGPLFAARMSARDGFWLTGPPEHLAWEQPQPLHKPFDRPDRFQFYISPELFEAYLGLTIPQANLSGAEARLLFRFVGGLSLQQMAQLDDLSVETKRSQFKSASAKLGCTGQVQVFSFITSQLAHLAVLGAQAARPGDAFETFTAEAFGSDARIGIVRSPAGNSVRYLELGHVTGRPILVFHGVLFPIILLGKAALLDRLGLRLIAPVRPGYLEGPAFDVRAADRHDAIQDAITVLDGLGIPIVDVLGSGFGVAHAARFAAENPGRSSQLIALTPFLAGSSPSAHPLGSLIAGLAATGMDADAVLRELTRADGSETSFLAVLDQLVGPVASDRAVFRMQVEGRPIHEILSLAFRLCLTGVARDIQSGESDWLDDFSRVRCPIKVLRGSEDTVSTKDMCMRLAQISAATTYLEIPGGGQFVESYSPTMHMAWSAMLDLT